ncbi:MAG: DNA polymerase III subunit alpha [Casimicrobiaceae bacterium]|nr:DNA polymerase III subunit alpha [Casimicrobiaceae bacterium]MDW8312869.1 DNA polymerase III subunit alpha [Burkholderiales bacterium]
MPAPRFVHLRLHSEYSIVDSTLRIGQAIELASADDQGALALTDLGNLFGFIKFYQAARAAGIKPICGVDVAVESPRLGERVQADPVRILLLAMSHTGYLNLCRLLTRAWRDNQRRGMAYLKPEWLSDPAVTEDLFCLSGGWVSEVAACLRAGQPAQAREAAQFWARCFPGRFALEIHQASFENEALLNEHTLEIAHAADLPVVATHPIQFARAEDWKAHEARVCIAEGYTLSDPRRPRRFTPEQCFRTQAEMAAAFAAYPEALENSVAIAELCNLELPLGKTHLPEFPLPPGVTIEAHLRAEVARGLAARLEKLYPDPAEREAARPRYEERAAYEIDTIVAMGFSGYFLIVADFIGWAKANAIPVGPGRGSGAGSLVAYALGITDLDPLKYNLLFERFLNPERVSMPDFDIDFCQDGRDRVIEYVRQKYGAESVGQIATFGTMAAKAAVRDCGRVLDLPYGFVDGVAKLIPFRPGQWTTLAPAPADPTQRAPNTIYAFEAEPLLVKRRAEEEEVAALLDLAAQVEGLPRNVGMHAGGVLIAPGKLTDFCPLYAQEPGAALVSQYDKDDIEAIGLVKFDFLGLTTLTILDWTLRYVRELDPSSTLRLEDIPLDDQATFQIFCEGDTVAIFQFESPNMRSLLMRAQPSRLEDLIALNALYRPGPMELIPDFIERKHGRQSFTYPDPRLEPVLAETYGIMVYQEQVMQAAQILAGYTLGGADLLRRAMGKKKPEEMAKHRARFREGAAKNGLSEQKADELFDLIEKFAGYGFNKSHSAAYALLAYQTAYFKKHHRAAFMAANLSMVMDDTDKVRALVEDSVAAGIHIEPPDVNAGSYRFVPIDRHRIRYGLGAIKGTGEAAIREIVRARNEGGPFTSLFDFCRRVHPHLVNRRTVEALIKAGAFDSIHPSRASALASVGQAMEWASQVQARAGQNSLFGEEAAHEPPLLEAPAWSLMEQLAHEKSALGLYLSGHPYEAWREHLSPIATITLARLDMAAYPNRVAGIVVALRSSTGRSGRMGFVTLDDRTAVREILIPQELFDQKRLDLKEDMPLVLEVQASRLRDGELRITASGLYTIDEARARFARRLVVHVNGQGGRTEVERILTTLRHFLSADKAAGLPVTIRVERPPSAPDRPGFSGHIELGAALRVRPRSELFAELDATLEF